MICMSAEKASTLKMKVEEEIDEASAIRMNGVPFFVFDCRYAISCAQPPELFLNTLQQSDQEWKK